MKDSFIFVSFLAVNPGFCLTDGVARMIINECFLTPMPRCNKLIKAFKPPSNCDHFDSKFESQQGYKLQNVVDPFTKEVCKLF